MKSTRKKAAREPLKTLGWREWVCLPGLGVTDMKAKIDTGAKTSAIHAFRITEFTENGQLWVSFYIHPVQRKKRPEISCRAQVIDKRLVRSSNGKEEARYVIETDLQIGKQTWPAEFTLTNRDEMGFRALIGRQALNKRFVVDPARSFIQKRTGAAPTKGSK